MGCFDVHEDAPRFRAKKDCTDIIWLIIFILFVGIMIMMTACACFYGNPLRLTKGYDSFGNICGVKNKPIGSIQFTGMDMTDRKYVFFLSHWNVADSFKLCVHQCPEREIKNIEELKNFSFQSYSNFCHVIKRDFNINNVSLESIDQYICPDFPIYESVPLFNRCVPKLNKHVAFKIIANIHSYLNNLEFLQQLFADFYSCWRTMAWLSFLAAGLSFVIAIYIHLFNDYRVWGFFVCVLVCGIAFIGILFSEFAYYKQQLDETPEIERLNKMIRNETAYIVYSVIATIITVIIFLLIVFDLRKKIEKIVTVFKKTSECIRKIPFLLLQPIWTFLLLYGFITFWVCVMLLLATANKTTPKRIHPVATIFKDSKTDFNFSQINLSTHQFETDIQSVEYKENTWIQHMWWLYVIGLIWFCEFILASQQMVIAGAVVHWYFYRNNSQETGYLVKSFRRVYLYHIGSVFLGSFLITIFKLPRIIFTVVDNWLKNFVPNFHEKCKKSPYTKCCVWSFENFIRYMNHNAYVVVVVRGYSFCPSAKRAFETVHENVLSFISHDKVGDVVLFFGKFIVTTLTGLVGLVVMKNDPNIYFHAGPVFVICLFSYFIAHCFFSVFEIVMDTLLMCMCDDYYINKEDTSLYNAPESFWDFMHIKTRNIDRAVT